jgi:hypothetical protein
MGWKRIGGCLMCGKDRCLENKDEPGVGYCFRFQTMHRNGKPFIKVGQTLRVKQRELDGFWEGGKGVFEKRLPFSSSQKDGQMEFDF